MPNALVKNYVDEALDQLRRLNLMKFPGHIPEPMQDFTIPSSNDWKGWKPVPSTVTDADLDELEREIRLAYPPVYREFLKYLHFIDLTEVGIRFERHMCHDWRDTLRKSYFRSWPREYIIDRGLIPFADESLGDSGPVCFDTKRRLRDGDCPVVFWDHESTGKKHRFDEKTDLQPIFSSGGKMFECLTLAAKHNVGFAYHDNSDDPSLLPRKRELLAEFLALDPEGAGGAARRYWTCWGVSK